MSKTLITRRNLLKASGAATGLLLMSEGPQFLLSEPNPFKVTMTTLFWVGEPSTDENDFIPNDQSYWDKDWQANYGGVDDPVQRNKHWPAGFTPKQNPFYVALPYGEFTEQGELAQSERAACPMVPVRSRPPVEELLGRNPAGRPLMLRPMAGCGTVRRGRLRLCLWPLPQAAQHLRGAGRIGCLAGGLALPRHAGQWACGVALRRGGGRSGGTMDRNRHDARQQSLRPRVASKRPVRPAAIPACGRLRRSRGDGSCAAAWLPHPRPIG